MLKFRFDRRIIRVLKPSNLLGDGRNAKKGGRREAKVREAGGSDPPVPPPPPPHYNTVLGHFCLVHAKTDVSDTESD